MRVFPASTWHLTWHLTHFETHLRGSELVVKKKKGLEFPDLRVERETGFEPATFSLGISSSARRETHFVVSLQTTGSNREQPQKTPGMWSPMWSRGGEADFDVVPRWRWLLVRICRTGAKRSGRCNPSLPTSHNGRARRCC